MTSPISSLMCQPESHWLSKQRVFCSSGYNLAHLNNKISVCKQIPSLYDFCYLQANQSNLKKLRLAFATIRIIVYCMLAMRGVFFVIRTTKLTELRSFFTQEGREAYSYCLIRLFRSLLLSNLLRALVTRGAHPNHEPLLCSHWTASTIDTFYSPLFL